MKKVLTFILTALVFLAATVLTVASVYRVSAVTLELSAVSEEAHAEAETLEKSLAAYYKTRSIFSVTDERAKQEFENYPHFRITAFKKAYPNRLIVQATEDAEVYAVERKNGYYILGGDGTLLCERETPINRSDGKNNVLVCGLSFVGVKGEIPTDEYFSIVFPFARQLDEAFGGIRSNVASISVENTQYMPDDVLLRMSMKEGLEVVVYNPAQDTEQKAENFRAFYAEMKTSERMTGTVFVSNEGKCNYEA